MPLSTTGMNKSQLADAAGVDRTLVHRIENYPGEFT